MSGHCSFDNIIAVQEEVNSLEQDINVPSWMLLNINIEKAYKTLN